MFHVIVDSIHESGVNLRSDVDGITAVTNIVCAVRWLNLGRFYVETSTDPWLSQSGSKAIDNECAVGKHVAQRHREVQ